MNRDRLGRVAAVSVLIDCDKPIPVILPGANVEVGKLARIAGQRISNDHAKIFGACGTHDEELHRFLRRAMRA
jgi:hypothetical protein